MSYPKDLDEYTDIELQSEVTRRLIAGNAGLCNYCSTPLREPTKMGWSSCVFPERHGMEKGHVPHLVLGAVRWDGTIVSQDDVDAVAARRNGG